MRQDASTGDLTAEPEDAGTALHGDRDASGQPLLQVKVYSPYRTYYNERAYSISAVNPSGPFDILPGHHKFISLLQACELSIVTLRAPLAIKISGGIMHVRSNSVSVLLDV